MSGGGERIDLNIDRLRLDGDGLHAVDPDLVRRALEAELAERLAVGPAPRPARRRTDSAASVSWSPGGDAADLGRQLGEAVHGRIPR